ncbi:hypothetical protein IPJ72_04745 [Candidatus Peregrinibacteria bacterium]|nr:MAG: hypothetical protein IPJ72_04745 [Candidatus Peregrinibacteria bacterium]
MKNAPVLAITLAGSVMAPSMAEALTPKAKAARTELLKQLGVDADREDIFDAGKGIKRNGEAVACTKAGFKGTVSKGLATTASENAAKGELLRAFREVPADQVANRGAVEGSIRGANVQGRFDPTIGMACAKAGLPDQAVLDQIAFYNVVTGRGSVESEARRTAEQMKLQKRKAAHVQRLRQRLDMSGRR